MIHTAISESVGAESPGVQERFMQAYRWMLVARMLDDKMASLYRAGKIHGGVFLGRGQEALSVALALALRPKDVYAPLIRDTAGRLAFGENLLDAARTCLGSAVGPMRGRDGNVHRGKPREGYLAMISHLGAMIAVVNGVLMARRLKGEEGTVGAACIGDGATSTGACHEALNQAAVERLPLVVVVADNQFAYSTPTAKQFACRSLVDRAAGYGMQGWGVDGTNLASCLKVLEAAVQRARSGSGPQLVVGRLLRLCGHGEHDDAHYIGHNLKESDVGRDCLKLAEEQLLQRGWVRPDQLADWRQEAIRQIEEAVAQAQRESAPDPYREQWTALSSPHLCDGFSNE